MPTTRKRDLHSFVADRVQLGATIYTDELASYRGLPNHATVNHGVGRYVSEQAHVNGMESFWSMMKRGRPADRGLAGRAHGPAVELQRCADAGTAPHPSRLRPKRAGGSRHGWSPTMRRP